MWNAFAAHDSKIIMTIKINIPDSYLYMSKATKHTLHYVNTKVIRLRELWFISSWYAWYVLANAVFNKSVPLQ